MPEHHEEAYIFFPLELATGEVLCALGVLRAFVCCMSTLAKDNSNGLSKVNFCSCGLGSGHGC